MFTINMVTGGKRAVEKSKIRVLIDQLKYMNNPSFQPMIDELSRYIAGKKRNRKINQDLKDIRIRNGMSGDHFSEIQKRRHEIEEYVRNYSYEVMKQILIFDYSHIPDPDKPRKNNRVIISSSTRQFRDFCRQHMRHARVMENRMK